MTPSEGPFKSKVRIVWLPTDQRFLKSLSVTESFAPTRIGWRFAIIPWCRLEGRVAWAFLYCICSCTEWNNFDVCQKGAILRIASLSPTFAILLSSFFFTSRLSYKTYCNLLCKFAILVCMKKKLNKLKWVYDLEPRSLPGPRCGTVGQGRNYEKEKLC